MDVAKHRIREETIYNCILDAIFKLARTSKKAKQFFL